MTGHGEQADAGRPSAAREREEGRWVSDEGREGAGDPQDHGRSEAGQAAGIPQPAHPLIDVPPQTPLFHAGQAERYARQALIRQYEACFGCNLIVVVDAIFPYGVTLLEEVLFDIDPSKDLHLMLDSPGGDGETAVRLVRSMQARCRELTVIVPNQAKSAGTILVIGAHHILMGPTSDLGPVDPQFQSAETGKGLYSAKDLITAVENAEDAIAGKPDTYPLHVSLLADVNAVMVQQARSALERTGDLVREALSSNPDRSEEEVKQIAEALQESLIDLPLEHGAVFGAADAHKAGLPVIDADPQGEQWKLIWRLWAKYFTLQQRVYEGNHASQVMPYPEPPA